MAQPNPDRLTYTGGGLGATAVLWSNIPAQVGTLTGLTISIPNTITGDCIFTIYRKAYNASSFSSLTTLTISSGNYKATVTGLLQACVEGDSLQIALTTLPTGQTIQNGLDLYLHYDVDTDASTTEVLTGTNTTKNVTPNALAALWEKGSDIASASTISIGEGGFFHVTGTTTITDIDFATDKAGRKVWLKFNDALILTHNATTLILPTGANITTAAGDIACFVSEGSDAVRCISYTRASGAALTGGATNLDSLSDVVITAAASGEYIRHNGTNWVDATIQAADLPTAIDAVKLADGSVSNTEFQYLNGVTSAIQTQLDGKQASDAFLDDIAALTDPNADRLLFWDDSAGDIVWLTVGSNLSISGTTISATGGGGGSGTFIIDDGTAVAGGTFTFDDGTAA